jgi:DNA-binding response OmpR family regulator
MAQIIIVDDEVEILAPLEQMLAQEGYHVSAFPRASPRRRICSGTAQTWQSLTLKCPKWMGFRS